jgi:hypothetical protein
VVRRTISRNSVSAASPLVLLQRHVGHLAESAPPPLHGDDSWLPVIVGWRQWSLWLRRASPHNREGRTAHARDEVMTSEEAEDAWLRFLLRTGPRVDGVVLRVIAERLANATEADELLALAGGPGCDRWRGGGGSDVRGAGDVVLMALRKLGYRNENRRLTCPTPMHRPRFRPSEA